MGIFDRFKKKDSLTLTPTSFDRINVDEPLPTVNFDPPMYLIPLDHNKAPLILQRQTGDNIILAGVTNNGKTAFFPGDFAVVDSIIKRISQRFPNDVDPDGTPVTHYLAVGVIMRGDQKTSSVKFIFEVCGFNERPGGGVETLYNTLAAACATQVGSIEHKEIEKVLSSGPVGDWINQSVVFLKKQLRWPEYVQNAMGDASSTGSNSSPGTW